MRARTGRGLGLLAILTGASCATQMYEGARRSSNEVAILQTDGTIMTAVDGRKWGSNQDVAVLPGVRAISVRLKDVNRYAGPLLGAELLSSTRSLTICFRARADHTYTVRPAYEQGQRWHPEVIDQKTASAVRTTPLGNPRDPCGRDD